MSNPIYIAGKGFSAADYDWPIGVPIMGVSAGYQYVPEMAHWVSLDRPVHFPDWLVKSDRFDKHVADNRFAPHWREYPRVFTYPIRRTIRTTNGGMAVGEFEAKEPTWKAGDVITQCGELSFNHSLLFAVQVAAHLGYDELRFIGVDLLDNDLHPVSDQLRAWHNSARAAGIQWFNASGISILGEWMPALNAGVTCGTISNSTD